MALKTLQKKYDELLKVFEEVGVTLTESQKDSLDTFMLDFQRKLQETRDSAIRATKKIVEERMEKEYRTVFESVMKHQQELLQKSGRIDVAKSQQVLAEAVDHYLDRYVGEVLPKKELVDYKRMARLEKVHESLKDMLLVSDEAVEAKVQKAVRDEHEKALAESRDVRKELDECKALLKKTGALLEESNGKCERLQKDALIEQKVRNLPIAESRIMRERLGKMTVGQIQKEYEVVLEDVQKEIGAERDAAHDEKSLEEAIADIMEGDKAPDKNGNGEDGGTEPDSDGNAEDDASTDGQEPDEGDEGGVQVTESMMQSWIDTLARLAPMK